MKFKSKYSIFLSRGLVFTCLILSLVGCGFKVQKTKGLDIQYVDSSKGTPLELQSIGELLDCDSNQLFKAKYYSNYRYDSVDVDYKPSFINKHYIGGNKEFFNSTFRRQGSRSLNDLGREFVPCGGYDYSKQESVEGAMASVLNGLSHMEKIKSLLPKTISKLRLRVHTNIKRITEKDIDGKVIREEATLVNNAFYASGSKEIIFLPQGKTNNGRIPFSSVPMWEIPFVSLHEYAHHLFSEIVTNYTNDSSLSHNDKLCFDNNHKAKVEVDKKSYERREVGFRDIFNSINEGMADLFSSLVAPKTFSMKGITCLEKTREVESGKFANNANKVLDEYAIDQFFSPVTNPAGNCLQRVNYQDIHMIGAIVAHFYHRVLDVEGLSLESKVLFWVEYLEQINSKYYYLKTLPLKKLLEEMVLIGFRRADKMIGYNKETQCNLLSSYFPSLGRYYSCE